jgi:glycogen synthase
MPELRKAALFTNEYPPNVYGGAGVHVEYLAQELSRLLPLEVRCFGDQDIQAENLRVRGYAAWDEMKRNTDERFSGATSALSRSLAMAKDTLDADIVHCHTWYVQMAGFWARLLWDVPFVLTTHSLEPLRPWKAEQLGTGYNLSSWVEKNAIETADAVIAVSRETRNDILNYFDVKPERIHIIHNGIDLDEYQKTDATDALHKYGIDPERPFVLFVGRITRQKGIIHLVNAIPHIDPSLQIVLAAGAPDTDEIRKEMNEGVAAGSAARKGIIWIDEMLPREKVIQLYSHATVFCCPSVYEPFGIINLEAMACETAVVASAVGGIPEVVVPDETGVLVDLELTDDGLNPVDPQGFERRLAEAINSVALDPQRAAQMGQNGRRRAEEQFSWSAIARKTLDLYQTLVR